MKRPLPPASDGRAPREPARSPAEGEGEETLLTVPELTIPGALIDGGPVSEAGPEALTLPGELVESLRPVRLAGDHYTPVGTAPGPPERPGHAVAPRERATFEHPARPERPAHRRERPASPRGREAAPGGEGPTTRLSLRTETVFLSESEQESRACSLGPLTAARGDPRRRRGLQALLFAPKQRPPRPGTPLRGTLLIMTGLCAMLALGTVTGRLVRRARQQELRRQAEAAEAEARRTGTLAALRQAAARYSQLLALLPADEAALRARAVLLAEALYELGGPADSDGREVAAFTQEVERAVRLVQGDSAELAQAAQAYLLLARGDTAGAAQRVQALRGTPLGEYLESQLRLLRGEDDEALRALARATARRPGHLLWLLNEARLLRTAGRAGEAQTTLGAALRQNRDHAGARILRDCRGGGAEAEQMLRPLLDPPPSRMEAVEGWLCLGEAVLQDEPPDLLRARRHLQRAEALLPAGAPLLRERLARAFLEAGEQAAAERLGRALQALAPARSSGALVLSQALLHRGQAQEALETLQPLLRSGLAEARLVQIRALLLLDETLAASKLAEATAGPGRTEALLLQAEVALRLAEVHQARQLLQQLGPPERLPPAQRRAAQLLDARLLLQERKPAQARAVLEELLGRAPQLVEARLLLARLLQAQGEPGLARAQLEAALAIAELPAARRQLAALALAEGDPALALRQYERLLPEARDSEVLLGAARAHRLSGDAQGALRLLQQLGGGRDGPGEAALVEQARALLQLGRGEEVLRRLWEPARTARQAALPALLMRALLRLPGRSRQARRVLAGLPPAQRRDPEVQLTEAELLLEEGQPQAARQLLLALLQRLGAGALSSEQADLRAEARTLLERTHRPQGSSPTSGAR